jgi:hypothetical protein
LAKAVYKIPYSIDNIRFRALVSLKIGNFGPKRQVYIYQVVGWLVVTMITAGLIYMTSMKYALIWAVPFSGAMFGLGWLGLQTQKNGLPGYRWIKPTFEYMVNKGDRYYDAVDQTNGGVKRVRGKKNKIIIRFSDELQHLRSLTELDAISGESVVSFQNGDVGAMFRVSGYTSLVIMDNEMDQIVDAIARWNGNLDPESSWELVTDRSSQRVKNQKDSIRATAQEWTNVGAVPKPISQLLKARFDDLSAVHQRHKSSQQYLLLRSASMDKLDKELQQLNAVTKQGMLKSLELLEGDELISVFNSVMKGS